MNAKTRFSPWVITLALMPGCGGKICDADALIEALAGAGEGDEISVGACTLEGNFLIPRGVGLSGEGAASILRSDSGVTVRLDTLAGAQAARVEAIEIRSSGQAALHAFGSGAAIVRGVEVEVELGLGVVGEALASFEVRDVSIAGPVNDANIFNLPDIPTSTESGTHGLVLIDVAAASLFDTNVRGFASFGALAIDTQLSWEGGEVRDNRAVGVMIEGGGATLNQLQVLDTKNGFRLIPAYGVVASGGAVIESAGLRAENTEGVAIFQNTGSARHLDLEVRASRNAGVWSQFASAVELSGTIEMSRFAGVVSLETGTLMVHDAEIAATEKVLHIIGETRATEIGDGLEIRGPMQSVTLQNLSLENNERAGVLFDFEGAGVPALSLSGVTVTVTSTIEAAVVAQGGVPPAGWDSGVMRRGKTEAEDRALTSTPCFSSAACVSGQECQGLVCVYLLLEDRTSGPPAVTPCSMDAECNGMGICRGNVCAGGPCDYPRAIVPPI